MQGSVVQKWNKDCISVTEAAQTPNQRAFPLVGYIVWIILQFEFELIQHLSLIPPDLKQSITSFSAQ